MCKKNSGLGKMGSMRSALGELRRSKCLLRSLNLWTKRTALLGKQLIECRAQNGDSKAFVLFSFQRVEEASKARTGKIGGKTTDMWFWCAEKLNFPFGERKFLGWVGGGR